MNQVRKDAKSNTNPALVQFLSIGLVRPSSHRVPHRFMIVIMTDDKRVLCRRLFVLFIYLFIFWIITFHNKGVVLCTHHFSTCKQSSVCFVIGSEGEDCVIMFYCATLLQAAPLCHYYHVKMMKCDLAR